VTEHAAVTWTTYLSVSTLLTGLVACGIGSLSRLMTEVARAQDALARMAVSQERLTVARNLHEVLGQDLTAMMTKAQLALRLLAGDPGQARDLVAEVLEIARRVASGVRSVAGGYRRMSLDAEVESAVAILTAAGIGVEAAVPPGAVPAELDTILAVVLREAAASVLRHSGARRCRIEICAHGDRVRMRVTSDGTPPGTAEARAGSGLPGLASRVAAIGGDLAVVAGSGSFSLTADVPLPCREFAVTESECSPCAAG
jgi:signal transduction histidine kinase